MSSGNSTGTVSQQATSARPTVVLVHGAFADASSWSGVVQRLRQDGNQVVAVANPLRGLHDDAAYLRGVLATIEGPVVLAGHSYGGSVISEAATGNPDVKALVYVAAFIPDTGESAGVLAAKFPGSTLGDTVEPAAYPLPDGSTGTELTIRQDLFHHQFAADVPADTALVMAATQRPVSTRALEEPAGQVAWNLVPAYSLVSGQDFNIPPQAQQWMAERADAHIVTVDGASHAATVSEPEAVTDLIRRAISDIG
ncbi:alpha/beta fold hydrolase [Streptomyces sp. NBC_00102]|uniref:alpha/beta fold hydrolase n=1 Tax=Streptomyces sp. NBC_00102 TaxID=2975652 RepID=UPI00225A6297|nr:alpha/beta hydrolase [Streptomyces sp. NBC_00102]MCX5399145.1 alpha/beta hydrolase [Streptomyces sp. NBC_00102]